MVEMEDQLPLEVVVSPDHPVIRDSLGINMDDGEFDGASSVRSTGTVALQRDEMRAQLKAGLSSLPTPRNDYEIVIPDVSNYCSFVYCQF